MSLASKPIGSMSLRVGSRSPKMLPVVSLCCPIVSWIGLACSYGSCGRLVQTQTVLLCCVGRRNGTYLLPPTIQPAMPEACTQCGSNTWEEDVGPECTVFLESHTSSTRFVDLVCSSCAAKGFEQPSRVIVDGPEYGLMRKSAVLSCERGTAVFWHICSAGWHIIIRSGVFQVFAYTVSQDAEEPCCQVLLPRICFVSTLQSAWSCCTPGGTS